MDPVHTHCLDDVWCKYNNNNTTAYFLHHRGKGGAFPFTVTPSHVDTHTHNGGVIGRMNHEVPTQCENYVHTNYTQGTLFQEVSNPQHSGF